MPSFTSTRTELIGSAMLLFASSLLLLSQTYAYPSGAPESACQTRTPEHGVPPQTSSCPYKIQMSGWVPGDNALTLAGESGESFEGFLVTVLDKNSSPTGSFTSKLSNSVPSSTQAKLICNSKAITHTEPGEKQSVTLTWIAPQNLPKNAVFTVSYTVVQTEHTFWVDCNPVTLSSNGSTTTTPVQKATTVVSTPQRSGKHRGNRKGKSGSVGSGHPHLNSIANSTATNELRNKHTFTHGQNPLCTSTKQTDHGNHGNHGSRTWHHEHGQGHSHSSRRKNLRSHHRYLCHPSV